MSLLLVPVNGRHVHGLRALASRDEILGFVVRAQRLRARGAGTVFVVCEADRLLDLVVLTRRDEAPEQAELGFRLAELEPLETPGALLESVSRYKLVR